MDINFDIKYEKLKQYLIDNDGKYPSSPRNNKEQLLLKFCGTVRREHKQNILSKKHIKMMDKLDGWKWKSHIKTFDERIEELKEYIIQYKKIPSEDDKNKVIRSLGKWCSNKRKDRRNGKKINQDQINQLDTIEEWWW